MSASVLTMSDSFVPLVSAAKASRESSFASFAGNGKAASPAAPSNGTAVPAASPASACAAKPKITLQRNGDIVSSIRIQCGCGEVVELNCIY